MNWSWTTLSWSLLVLLLLVAAGWYLSYTAARVDRLHHRVESARAVLETQLARRSAAAAGLAASGLLDPASALLLADAASAAQDAGEDQGEREIAESELTEALGVVLDADVVAQLAAVPAGRTLLHELASACTRAALARRFLNDAVAQALRMRRKRVVRLARLAGRADPPATVEFDDTVPSALGNRSAVVEG